MYVTVWNTNYSQFFFYKKKEVKDNWFLHPYGASILDLIVWLESFQFKHWQGKKFSFSPCRDLLSHTGKLKDTKCSWEETICRNVNLSSCIDRVSHSGPKWDRWELMRRNTKPRSMRLRHFCKHNEKIYVASQGANEILWVTFPWTRPRLIIIGP